MRPHEEAAIRSALPLRVRDVSVIDPVATLYGDRWSLDLMCPWALAAPGVRTSWESPTLEDELWELIGRDLEAVTSDATGPGVVVFRFSGEADLRVCPDTDLEPWTFSAPDVVVVGRMSEEMAIRRLPDRHGLLRRRARYELRWTVDGSPRTIVTSSPARELSPLVGSRHPADLARWTESADLAWDGGEGQWRSPPDFRSRRPSPVVGGALQASDLERARRIIGRDAARSATVATLLLASTLTSVGHPAAGEALGSAAEALLALSDPSQRADQRDRLLQLWDDLALPDLEPIYGSTTEWAVCRLLIDDIPPMLARER